MGFSSKGNKSSLLPQIKIPKQKRGSNHDEAEKLILEDSLEDINHRIHDQGTYGRYRNERRDRSQQNSKHRNPSVVYVEETEDIVCAYCAEHRDAGVDQGPCPHFNGILLDATQPHKKKGGKRIVKKAGSRSWKACKRSWKLLKAGLVYYASGSASLFNFSSMGPYRARHDANSDPYRAHYDTTNGSATKGDKRYK